MFRTVMPIVIALSFACDSSSPTQPSTVEAGASTSAKSVVSVVVQGTPSLTGVGTTRQFTASAAYSDGSTADVTKTATWASSNTAVGTVIAGLFTATGFGGSDVSARVGSVAGGITVIVDQVPGGPGIPAIEFVTVPPYGNTSGALTGRVLHVVPANHHVAVYIKVGVGYWTKPTWASPATPIKPDGSWSCSIVTGGLDAYATEVRAYLLPGAITPPSASGQSSLPSSLSRDAVASVVAKR